MKIGHFDEVFHLDPISPLRFPLISLPLLDLALISLISSPLLYPKIPKKGFTKATLTSPCASLLSFDNPTRDTPLEAEENRPKVKRIGYLGDSGDHPSSSLLGCTLWIRAFIIQV